MISTICMKLHIWWGYMFQTSYLYMYNVLDLHHMTAIILIGGAILSSKLCRYQWIVIFLFYILIILLSLLMYKELDLWWVSKQAQNGPTKWPILSLQGGWERFWEAKCDNFTNFCVKIKNSTLTSDLKLTLMTSILLYCAGLKCICVLLYCAGLYVYIEHGLYVYQKQSDYISKCQFKVIMRW